MDWRSMTLAEIKANPMAYWRLRFLEERRRYGTPLRLTEYGFMRKCRARPTLARLRMVEAAIRCDVTCRGTVRAFRFAVAA